MKFRGLRGLSILDAIIKFYHGHEIPKFDVIQS